MNPTEQAILYGVTIVILSGTLIVWVASYIRMNRRDKDK
jgi:hypothetical protein